MRVGKIVHELGISRDTLLRFERRGLIAPTRDWAGHRRFSAADVERIRALVGGSNAPSAEVDSSAKEESGARR